VNSFLRATKNSLPKVLFEIKGAQLAFHGKESLDSFVNEASLDRNSFARQLD
jgi:hypothetical protein